MASVKLHVGRLKQYVDGNDLGKTKEIPSDPEEGEDEGAASLPEGEYEVDKIVDRRLFTRRSKVRPTEAHYVIRWKGYTEKEDTTENIEDLMGCARKVAEYWRSHPRLNRKDATPKELDVIAVGEEELNSEEAEAMVAALLNSAAAAPVELQK